MLAWKVKINEEGALMSGDMGEGGVEGCNDSVLGLLTSIFEICMISTGVVPITT